LPSRSVPTLKVQQQNARGWPASRRDRRPEPASPQPSDRDRVRGRLRRRRKGMALECASVTVASDEGRGPQLPEQTLLATDARGAGSARFTVHSRAAWKPYSTIGTKAVRSLALSSLLRAVRGCGRRHRSASDPNSTDPRPCLLTCSGHRGKRRFVGADLERELHQQLGARLLRSCECRRHLDGRPVSCEHVAQRRCPRSDLGDRGALQEHRIADQIGHTTPALRRLGP
jgi:hypothetical protein